MLLIRHNFHEFCFGEDWSKSVFYLSVEQIYEKRAVSHIAVKFVHFVIDLFSPWELTDC